MTCLDCKSELSYVDHRESMDALGVELCKKHKRRIDRLVRKNNTPIEAIQLYYSLKQAGASPMLEWWDGQKFIDLAFSRVKLNIEIDCEYEKLTEIQAINDLQQAMLSVKDGFTTLRIPHMLVNQQLHKTVLDILGIVEGLKTKVKII